MTSSKSSRNTESGVNLSVSPLGARRSCLGSVGDFIALILHPIADYGGTLLGFCGILLLWTAVLHLLATEHDQALERAAQSSTNLSRAFEEAIIRSVKSVDQTLLFVRDDYERDPAAFNIAQWTQKTQAITHLTFQISLIDRNGLFRSSNLLPNGERIDLSDREHFRAQRDSATDDLFISKPVMGRASHKWSIQMTRKLIAGDGSFDGVIVLSFDPILLSNFYDSIDVGSRGVVILAGVDGIIRAIGRAPAPSHAATKLEDQGGDSAIGLSLKGTRLFGEAERRESGWIKSRAPIDDVKRIYSYREVQGYPLIVSVGFAVDEVFAPYEANFKFDIGLAIALTILLSSVTVLVTLHQAKLKRTRGLLRASEADQIKKTELLETTLEHMSQGILMADTDMTVQICNTRAVEMLGLPLALMASRPKMEEVVRWQWQNGEFGKEGDAVDDDLRKFLQSGGRSDDAHIYERIRPSGITLEVRSTPLSGGGFVRTFTNITERKNTEIELRAARDKADGVARAKSEFLATMSHEIRSPMSGLVGVLELLQETKLDIEQSRMAAMVHSSAQSLLAVLNEILDFSKIEAGALSIVLEPVRLRQLMTDIVQPHMLHAARKGLDLGLNFTPDAPECVEVDPLRVRQILNNLLSNSIKFTAQGEVSVDIDVLAPRADEPESMLRLAVRDTGIGMVPEVSARLFEPFMQADRSTTRDFGGTGLGLCISQRLSGLLNGDLSVKSEKGEGSVFTLLLPLTLGTMPATASTVDAPRNRNFPGGGRVLVVDDDITNRWLAQRQLVALGLTADVAESGEAALAMLHADQYHLLLTDCHMPQMDGAGLASAVRNVADPVLRNIPIIGVTADVTVIQKKRCLEAGMNDVGHKPLSREKLFTLLSAFFSIGDKTEAVPSKAAVMDSPLPALQEFRVFDDGLYRELFPPGDPDGRDWLATYLKTAALLIGELETSYVSDAPELTPRNDVAAVAHRLAGNSLSVGATRLGDQARKLELNALTVAPANLDENIVTLRNEFLAAKAEISSFIDQLELELVA